MQQAKSLVTLIVLAIAMFPVLAVPPGDARLAAAANPQVVPSLEFRTFELQHIASAEALLVLRAICEARRLWSVTGGSVIVAADTRERLEVMSELLKRVDVSSTPPAASIPGRATALPAGPIPDTDRRRIDTFAPAGDLEFEVIALRHLDLESAKVLVLSILEARRVVGLPAQRSVVLADSRARLNLMADLLKRRNDAAASPTTKPASTNG